MSRDSQNLTPRFESSTLDDLFGEATGLVIELFKDTARRKARVAQFLYAEDALAALPLSTSEFALASRRLDNAFIYYQQSEFGACMYELWQLVRRLRHQY